LAAAVSWLCSACCPSWASCSCWCSGHAKRSSATAHCSCWLAVSACAFVSSAVAAHTSCCSSPACSAAST
jgi:hypothetical protein